MIDRTPQVVGSPTSPPPMLSEGSAFLDCGCRVYVGRRIDTMEAATAATPCGEHHVSLMDAFNDRLRASLDNPSERGLLEVVDEMLTALNEDINGEQ